jgi:hypothetical protein
LISPPLAGGNKDVCLQFDGEVVVYLGLVAATKNIRNEFRGTKIPFFEIPFEANSKITRMVKNEQAY